MEEVQRNRIFASTAEKLFKKDFGDQVKKRVAPLRWMEKLIKIGGSVEDTYHNEEVVALSMLANSYRAVRRKPVMNSSARLVSNIIRKT